MNVLQAYKTASVSNIPQKPFKCAWPNFGKRSGRARLQSMLTNKIIHKLQIRLLREYGLKFTADAIGFLSIVAEQVNQRHGQHLRRLHIRRLLIRNDVVCTVERAGNAAHPRMHAGHEMGYVAHIRAAGRMNAFLNVCCAENLVGVFAQQRTEVFIGLKREVARKIRNIALSVQRYGARIECASALAARV